MACQYTGEKKEGARAIDRNVGVRTRARVCGRQDTPECPRYSPSLCLSRPFKRTHDQPDRCCFHFHFHAQFYDPPPTIPHLQHAHPPTDPTALALQLQQGQAPSSRAASATAMPLPMLRCRIAQRAGSLKALPTMPSEQRPSAAVLAVVLAAAAARAWGRQTQTSAPPTATQSKHHESTSNARCRFRRSLAARACHQQHCTLGPYQQGSLAEPQRCRMKTGNVHVCTCM